MLFQKIFYISSELLRRQEFCTFKEKVHELAKCKHEECEVHIFFKKIKEVVFNEELSYEKRRIFFTETCLSQMSVFSAMFQLHHKEKKN